MLRLTRRIFDVAEPARREQLLSVTRLAGANELPSRLSEWVSRVIFLPEQEFVVVASTDSSVRVYDLDTTGEPRAVFSEHTDWVRDVVQLEQDLVASVGMDNRLLTWRPSDVELVGEWAHTTLLYSVGKLDESRIVVGDHGDVIVLSHTSGTSFQVQRRLCNAHSKWVKEIVVHSTLIVTCSQDAKAKVWNTSSLELEATLRHRSAVNGADVSDRNIVTVCDNGRMYVYRNTNRFPLDYVLRSNVKELHDVHILSDDEIIVVAGTLGLSFISMSQKSSLSRTAMEHDLFSFVVLPDGRIALSDKRGYCAIVLPPESVRGAVVNYSSALYQSVTVAVARVPPLRAAWIAVQDGELTLLEACETVITSENCSASLDEWCVAHNLLMEAIKKRVIPASRHYSSSIAHWHCVLYQHCAKLALGGRCIEFIKVMFKEAEDVGVIAEGQVESLINSIGIRCDVDKDNRFAVHAIYQLFLRQAEMDVRLREVLHYQRVEQLRHLVKAFVGCIPVAGAMFTNMISSGAVILNEMQYCGLVESLLGVGKDEGNKFDNGGMVNSFLRRSTAMLSVEEWTKLPAESRKVIEDVASNLGLTVEELREKLLIVAEIKACGDDETSTEQVIINEVDENDQAIDCEKDEKKETAAPAIHNSDGAASPSVESGDLDGTSLPTLVLEDELKAWRERGVGKEAVGRLRSEEIATCLAAYLANYDAKLDGLFVRYRVELTKRFESTGTFGEHFVDADEEDKKMLFEEVTTALAAAKEGHPLGPAKMMVKKFIRLVNCSA